MPIICPTITALNEEDYRKQAETVAPFAERIHIDLMDGKFTVTKSPSLEQIWWPIRLTADIHLMYKKPMTELKHICQLKPNLVIIHAEADCDHKKFTDTLHENGIKAGIALLHDTPADFIKDIIRLYDHVMLFSGDLGKHGGVADLKVLDKVKKIRSMHRDVELGWDGGVNDENAAKLIKGGINVLNVGGFIQKSQNPSEAYAKLKSIV
ncbi:MAG: ribulose-phosphate 3-epimerase [Candidatus Saccharimonadales bacterium]